jgi:DNA-binding transcriptional MocR family regulator
MRLAYSRVADDLIDEGVRRIGAVVRTALEDM